MVSRLYDLNVDYSPLHCYKTITILVPGLRCEWVKEDRTSVKDMKGFDKFDKSVPLTRYSFLNKKSPLYQ